jgi:nitroimidazol reductase NimA-like FMN-containing flavoprotein (pyridoxamine 5'-phosphate oxidase superfamily)
VTQATQLTSVECRALLEEGVVGRVAMATPVGPRITPVSYVVHDGAVVFRTTPYSELSTYGWNVDLAFETDRLDTDTRQGWSVVAVGRAHLVEDPDEIRRVRQKGDPEPWAPGTRHLYVSLVWRQLTGVRLARGPRPQPAARAAS